MLAVSMIDELVDRALGEDLGSGDLTTDCCLEPGAVAQATALSRAELVACGGLVFRRCFERADPELRVELLQPDGALLPPQTPIWQVRGPARSLLGAERVALNFAQRMSGIATLTHRYVAALPAGSTARVTDTRKTTPGLRALERYAVRVGGGHNHRDDLGSAVLIKDNHIAAVGGIARAIGRARERAPHTSRIEVEVDTLDELGQAIAAGADIVMLDNMDDAAVAQAVARAAAERKATGRPLLEVSGGITVDRVASLARLGVDVISVGALTHSAPAADIALEIL